MGEEVHWERARIKLLINNFECWINGSDMAASYKEAEGRLNKLEVRRQKEEDRSQKFDKNNYFTFDAIF
jgi:hypothetical protein